jgi:hypothetical protein
MKIARNIMVLLAGLLSAATLQAANTQETVPQVSGEVSLTADVDYIVTSATPFANNGVVNIVNTDHAVLILAAVKPSAAQTLINSHVLINGARAVNNTNCQVKLYNRGCIILPYGNNVKPLTVYSEQNFKGEECSDFGLENDGGFMNTLTDKKLNNRIRSFKLKRGYMVSFSLKAKGRGYSRCFIAADEDIEMATMPIILDRSITSYRLFKWYDAGKPALANDTRGNVVDILNVTSCYSFGLGENRLPDAECVPHHIYEDWPSAAACGAVSYSPHMKTNNEPGNSADDHPQSVETILNNWENLMATGMRLCSPSSHDGSLGHLREFLDSIDERGWRCDIIDLHCYWPENNFYNSIKGWVDRYHRPIWISEWVWGASWNNNGIFGEAQGAYRDNPTQAQLSKNRDVVRNICNALNGYSYVERYYYWNSEANCSKLYYNNKLTPAGEMYSKLDGGLAYNGSVNYVPSIPKQQAPKNLTINFDKKANKADLTWYEYNHEMNEYIHLECRTNSDATWTVVNDITGLDSEGTASLKGIEAKTGWQFRIVEKDATGKVFASNTVMAASNTTETGDAVTVGDKEMYVGGNLVLNSSFDLGLYGWTNGKGEPIGQPWFEAISTGGADGGAFLQCCGHGNTDTEKALLTVFTLQPDTWYYFSADSRNVSSAALARYSQLALTTDGKTAAETVANIDNTTANWNTKFSIFNSGSYTKAMLTLPMLFAKSQFDNIVLCPLFDTEQQALADGEARLQQQAAERAEAEALMAKQTLPRLQQLTAQTKAFNERYQLTGHEQIQTLLNDIEQNVSNATPQWINGTYTALQQALAIYLPSTIAEGLVKEPDFKTTKAWQTKAGTYQGGDQRSNTTSNGISFWNAWWNIAAEGSNGQTMAVRQQVSTLPHGLYAVECEATTEHYCLSDQHAYISNGSDSLATPLLTADYMDLPSMADSLRWQTLTSMPIYVDEGGSVTIGFESSKQGAIDMAWREIGKTNSNGDHREGWWAATNFRLRHLPLYRTATAPQQWGVMCLPYAVAPSEGLTFYQIAGITPDHQHLCLEELAQTEAGMPFIYMATQTQSTFLEYGDKADMALDAPGNLTGYFNGGTLKVRKGYYALIDGAWKKITDSANRPLVGNFTAIMRPIDASHTIPVIAAWAGATMPIEGVSEEEIAAGIQSAEATRTPGATIYSLDGRAASTTTAQPGVYVKKTNGKTTKTIRR